MKRETRSEGLCVYFIFFMLEGLCLYTSI